MELRLERNAGREEPEHFARCGASDNLGRAFYKYALLTELDMTPDIEEPEEE